MTTYLDVKHPDFSVDGAEEHVEWWREETARWHEAYANLSDEVNSLNPFADPSHAQSLLDELATVAANLAEATAEPLRWLDELATERLAKVAS